MVDIKGDLANEVFAATYHVGKRLDVGLGDEKSQLARASLLRQNIRSATRYIVDDEVTRAATRLGVEHPDVLLALLPRSRPPFAKTWVEWNPSVAMEEGGEAVPNDSTKIVGALVEQLNADGEPTMYRATEIGIDPSTSASMAVVSAVGYVWSTDQTVIGTSFFHQERSEIARFTETPKERIDQALVGSVFAYNRQVDENEDDVRNFKVQQIRKLTEHATHCWSEYNSGYQGLLAAERKFLLGSYVKNQILESTGGWRFLVSLFAVLQSREYTSYTPGSGNAARRRFVGNKVVPYLQSYRVKVNLPRAIIVRKAIESVRDSLPRARHKVEGHWAESHVHAERNCDHVDVMETPDRYRCALCSRARWWRKEHMRGDSRVGFITKERLLTKRHIDS